MELLPKINISNFIMSSVLISVFAYSLGNIVDNIKEFEGVRSSFSSVYVDKSGERQIVNYRDPNLPEDASWMNAIDALTFLCNPFGALSRKTLFDPLIDTTKKDIHSEAEIITF